MALPKIDLPTFKVYLPSLEKEVSFRPFIVKEEKLLLIANESDDFETTIDTIKQVIQNCIVTEGVDVNALPLFEIEFMFLHLRARSMGEKINLAYICENVVDDKPCKNEMELEVDLLKAALDTKVNNNNIKLTDKVGIKLRYPSIEVSRIINSEINDVDKAIQLIEDCTEYLYDDEQVYKVSEMQPGEFKKFIEDDLTQAQFQKLRLFFENIPTIKYSSDLTCKKCSKVHKIELEGILDFFV